MPLALRDGFERRCASQTVGKAIFALGLEGDRTVVVDAFIGTQVDELVHFTGALGQSFGTLTSISGWAWLLLLALPIQLGADFLGDLLWKNKVAHALEIKTEQ